jgi:SAM-dependent methyltransferase
MGLYDDPRLARVWEVWDDHGETQDELEFVEWACANLACRPVRKILDAGAGTGRHALPLAKRGYEITATDASPHMIRRLRRRAKDGGLDVRAWAVGFEELDFEEEFDALVCIAAFAYLTTDAAIDRALRAFHRALKPGGIAIIHTYNAVERAAHSGEARSSEHESGGVKLVWAHASRMIDDVRSIWRSDGTLTFTQGKKTLVFVDRDTYRMQTKPEMLLRLSKAAFGRVKVLDGFDHKKKLGRHAETFVFVALK